MELQDLKLIIGLGNPDKQYEQTYHNVGFWAVDFFAQNPQLSNLLKTDVYMNQSGGFVKKTLKKYKIKPENLLIVHDDADIKIGKYKISFGCNSAGHKGVESIIKSLGTKNFWRLRIGIDKNITSIDLPALARRAKAGDYVLKKIAKKDVELIKKAIKEAEKILKTI